MIIAQSIYAIKKYKNYSWESLLLSSFIYEAWKKAEEKSFELYIEDDLNKIISQKGLISLNEMDSLMDDYRPHLEEVAFFGNNPEMYRLMQIVPNLSKNKFTRVDYIYLRKIYALCREESKQNPENLSLKSLVGELFMFFEDFKNVNIKDYYLLYAYS